MRLSYRPTTSLHMHVGTKVREVAMNFLLTVVDTLHSGRKKSRGRAVK